MKVVKTIKEFQTLKNNLLKQIGNNANVGFIPTMGYLHQGHLSLIQRSKSENHLTCASIFVNPTQFGPKEDLSKYPRNLDRDIELLSKEKCDILFAPSPEEMYGNMSNYKTYVVLEGIDSQTREGRARPGHFRGVATVVTKLFNIVGPQRAYFGQKDGQQCIVIKKFVKDLNIPVEVVICPTLREKDGLAMSSRNSYLSDKERSVAPLVYGALLKAKNLYQKEREYDAKRLVQCAIDSVQSSGKRAKDEHSVNVRLDYIDIADMETGLPLLSETGESIPNAVEVLRNNGAMLSTAVFVGTTRLIDNLIIRANDASLD